MKNEKTIDYFLDLHVRDILKMCGQNLLNHLYLIRKRPYCRHIYEGSNLMIISNGQVCCTYGDNRGSSNVGNIKERTLAEIFHGKEYTNLRNQFLMGKIPFSECIRCDGFRIMPYNFRPPEVAHFPKRVHLETQAYCNLNCFSCHRSIIANVRGNEMRMKSSLVERIVQEVGKSKQVKEFNLFGYGEPFLDPRTVSIVEKVSEERPDIHTRISTNGIPLSNMKLSRRVVYSGLKKLVFSIDGIDQTTYEKYQRGGKLNLALKGLENVLVARRDLNFQTPRVIWQCLLFRWNDQTNHIKKAREIAEQLGVDELDFQFTISPITGISRRYFRFNRNPHVKKISKSQ